MEEHQLQSQGNEALPICPSFSSYQIAGGYLPGHSPLLPNPTDDIYDYDFEFSLVQTGVLNLMDQEMFQIQEVYPVFNRDLLLNRISHDKADTAALLPSFEKLRGGRDLPPCSESEDDEKATSPGKFCVWMPQVVPASPSRCCKKSNSTGSTSKSSWKLRDLLLHRSNSEGKSKGKLGFLTPKKKERKAEKVHSFKQQHEEFYVKNQSSKDMQRRKSFRPYRPGLVGGGEGGCLWGNPP